MTTISSSPENAPCITRQRISMISTRLDVFYREAGAKEAPAILLLHGFPTSSNMFRNLIPRLADSFHVIAPDYPGYGQSSMPDHKEFAYTFENYAKIVDQLVEQLGVSKYFLVSDGLRSAGWLSAGIAASRAGVRA